MSWKKKKTEYCLLDDEDFLETHSPKSGTKQYCPEEYNYKFVNVYIKTGIFKEQLLASYIEIMKLKFKKIFNSNKKEKILALPSGENEVSKSLSKKEWEKWQNTNLQLNGAKIIIC